MRINGTRRGATVALVAATALLAGCGGDDAATPEQVAEDFYAATAEADAGRICELVTEETAQAGADDEGADTCEEGVTASIDAGDAEEAAALAEEVEIGEAMIDGDTATVQVSSGEETGEVELVKEDDEWRIDLAG